MATSVRRGDGAGKEKKGISPSTTSTTTRKTTRPLTSSISSSHVEKKTISSSTPRQVSSHLRPTRTTPNEPSRLSKKPIKEPSTPKPAPPPRRRSFGHLPPPSHVQKAIRDAKNSRSASTHKNTIKPASPLSRASSSDRLVKKEVRSLSMSPSVTKKNVALSSTPTTPRRGPSKETSLIKKATKSSTLESNLLFHGISSAIDDPFAIDIDDDLVNLDDVEVQSLPEISEMPFCGSDLGDPTILDDVIEQPIEAVDQENSSLEDGHKLEEDVSVVDNHVAEEPTTQETITTLDDVQIEEKQNIVEEQIEEGEQNEKEEDMDNQGVVDQEALSEAKKEDESPITEVEQVEIKTETNIKNDEKIDAKTNTKSDVANNGVVSKSQSSMVKKEKQQDYNDVIEQTATKLRSKKNKVLALAGAFETVISLQDKN